MGPPSGTSAAWPAPRNRLAAGMSTDTAQTSGQRYAAFRHSAFLRFLAARFLATFATQIVSVAVGWQIYDLTRDPFDLGLVGIVQFLPVAAAGAGHRRRLADRFGRRLIMGLPVGPGGAVRAGARAADLARPDRTGTDLRRACGVRHRPRLLRAGLVVADRQSGAEGGFRQRGRLELVGLADGDHRRPGRRRPALRAFGRDRLWHRRGADGGGHAADLFDPQAGAAQPDRQADARHAVCRLPLHLGATRSCSAPSRSTFSPCCCPAPWRCCRSMRATSSSSARGASACCAPRPASAPSSSPSG